MTREDTIKVLSILRVAYPNFYKGLSKQEANAVIDMWAMQFIDIPCDIVCIAINKLISTNKFPPSIAEVKGKLKSMYAEAVIGLISFDADDKEADVYRRIARCCRHIEEEPSLSSLVNSSKRGIAVNEAHDKQQCDMSLLQARRQPDDLL